MTEINLKAKALDILKILSIHKKAFHTLSNMETTNHHYKGQHNSDIIFVHGLNDYGGGLSEHVKPILEKGFRVIYQNLEDQVDGSLRGMIILCYAIKYPEAFDSFVVMAPLIYVHDKSRPSKLIENIAKILVKTSFGRLSFSKARCGKSSNDPLH
ncbi:17478_t:CDS:2 [Entrophospora sp. SA101]|nr:17478_t:CDS:2 [Entrophospora sp. SA101]